MSRSRPHAIFPTEAVVVGFLLALSAATPVSAQTPAAPAPALPGTAAEVPFRVGESGEYQVKLGALPVGSGVLEVSGIEEVSGHLTYRTKLHIRGGIPLARVDTRLESWIDVHGLFARQFEEDKQEFRFSRERVYDFSPESGTYRIRESGEVGRLGSREPLDDVSFLFFARTLPLEPGDTYTLPRYFKEDGNPVVLKVLRRDTITVPAGTFNTVVVQPIIRTDGLFGQGGEAEVHFTDDDRRILVHLRSRVPLVGSLTMSLRSYDAGS